MIHLSMPAKCSFPRFLIQDLWQSGSRVGLLWMLLTTMMVHAQSKATEAPLLVAHRGASYEAPENTVASVKLAWTKRADATEVDIHMTRDHQIVVIHDKSTKRTAGVDLSIAANDYASLKDLEVGSWKSPDYEGEPLPLLEEVLQHVPDGKQIFIEIKCPKEVLPYLKQVVHDSGLLAQQTVFIAFDWETIRQTKLIFPSSACYWLSGFKQDKTSGTWEPSAAEVLERALEAKVDGVDVSHSGPVSAQFVAAAHEKGLEVHVYTVNEIADARRVMIAGVDGITTDRPLFLREQLGL